MNDDLKLFSGNSNTSLAQEICTSIGIPMGRIKIAKFSNDNMFVQILENVRERDVFVVQSFTDPVSDHIMELMITLDALKNASARRVTAVIPYYSYARSDKKDASRVSIVGRLMADLLKTAGADRVLTMDLHADSVQGFFSIPIDHLTAGPLLCNYFKNTLDLSNAVAVATDAGGAKRVGRFAIMLNIAMAIIDKRRVTDTRVEQGLVVGDVRGKDAIVFDDEISTAGTLIATVETLKKAGARTVYVGSIHPVLCGPAVEKIRSSDIVEVVVTNTVEVPARKRMDKLKVLSVANLLGEAVRRIHTGESVGALFT
ncbi:MAG: ribose-phosphate pyrophosphokinase [Pseudomonadota bacterium]